MNIYTDDMGFKYQEFFLDLKVRVFVLFLLPLLKAIPKSRYAVSLMQKGHFLATVSVNKF